MKKNKELERLERELLAGEPQPEPEDDFEFPLDDTTPADIQVPYRNFANGYQAYTNQDADVDMDSYSEEVRVGSEKSNKPLIILALVLLACNALVLCWWAIRYAGVLG